MFKSWIQLTLGLSFFIYVIYCGLEVIPERAKVVYVNEKYFENVTANVKRYSRTSAYCFNIEMTLKKSWSNNVTIHVIFNEYLHNEYRRSFIEIHHKFCDLVEYDKLIGPMVHRIGLFCPLPVGPLRVTNFTFPMDKFPNVFPFEKCRIDSELKVTATNESMLLMYHYLTFKNLKKKNVN